MNERRWQVLFLRWPVHWTMRWVTRREPGYSHVILLSSIGNGQWLSFQWGFDGVFCNPVGEVMAARLMQGATEVLQFDQTRRARHSMLNSLLPNTCMTMARQLMGLPPRLNFFRSGKTLRGELLALGATVVIPARRTP